MEDRLSDSLSRCNQENNETRFKMVEIYEELEECLALLESHTNTHRKAQKKLKTIMSEHFPDWTKRGAEENKLNRQ